MKLPVVSTDAQPWYELGLRFSCSQCGNCCTGGPGFVWISDEEAQRLADHLGLSLAQTLQKYCRKFDGKLSLKEARRNGQYDCIFLQEIRVEQINEAGERTVQVKRACQVYPVRPLQCRTWPFWPENLHSPEAWARAAKRCHGMNQGRPFSPEDIHRIRDAADWPANPPTSGET